jgi:hypothetical protein
MSRTTNSQTVSCSEFLLHEPTHRVGLVIDVSGAGIESCKTIRLAEGERITAPSPEFRPATGSEVEHYHRVAAATQPFVMTTVATSYLSFQLEQVDD